MWTVLNMKRRGNAQAGKTMPKLVKPCDRDGRDKCVSPPTLNYGRRGSKSGNPEQDRRFLLWFFGVMAGIWIAWCAAMFVKRGPAIDEPFPLAFASPLLGVCWFVLGGHFITLMRRNRTERRYCFRLLIIVCFCLAPYTMMRAGGDVFALSLRYHLWRAGGADRVRAEFNQWVATRAAAGREWLFLDAPAGGGNLVPVPASSLPPAVRYIHEHFYSRFGGTMWNGAADLDDVTALTYTVIRIGPPGWEPDGGVGVIDSITGSRRRIADGIWLDVRTYDK